MKNSIIKRSRETGFVKCYGCRFTFADGVEIIANEKIANAAEILVDANIKVENGEKYKAIAYFYLEVLGGSDSNKCNLQESWITTEEALYSEAKNNTYKANDQGLSN